MSAVRAAAHVRAFPCPDAETHARARGLEAPEAETVVLRGLRPERVGGPVVSPPPSCPRTPAGRPAGGGAAHRAGTVPRPAVPRPSAAGGLGYPPPTTYPAVPMPRDAARLPAGLNTRLSGIVPVEIPASTGFGLLDRAIARARWMLACEPETPRGRHAAGGR